MKKNIYISEKVAHVLSYHDVRELVSQVFAISEPSGTIEFSEFTLLFTTDVEGRRLIYFAEEAQEITNSVENEETSYGYN